MGISRRKFLQYSGLTAGSILLPSGMAVSSEKVKSFPLHKPIREAATICPYCSCGCGLLIATGPDGHIINSEGVSILAARHQVNSRRLERGDHSLPLSQPQLVA